MGLQIGNILIEDVRFGRETGITDRTLVIDKQEMCDFLRHRDARISKLDVALAKPGESTRIICVKDVIEPWCKVNGDTPGTGRNQVLKNVAVVTCGKIVGFQEGIIDMRGPGALYSPFSRTCNVVLEIEVLPELTPHQHEDVIRHAGLAAAAFIGEAARTLEPDEIETYAVPDTAAVSPDLPRIAYVYMLLSQGLLHDTYVFGQNAKEDMPRILGLPELMDNCITSGNCVSACDKNTTYHHQNNPIVRELYQRHGKDLNFVGLVLTNEPVRLAAKVAAAEKAIELVKTLKATGVVISKEGFGNPDADQMFLIRGLEQAGIKTTAITDEYAGPDGRSQSLADATPEADGIVSVGNANERLVLPPMDRLLGPLADLTHLSGAYPQSLRKDGSLEVELQGIVGSTNELGSQTLSCREV